MSRCYQIKASRRPPNDSSLARRLKIPLVAKQWRLLFNLLLGNAYRFKTVTLFFVLTANTGLGNAEAYWRHLVKESLTRFALCPTNCHLVLKELSPFFLSVWLRSLFSAVTYKSSSLLESFKNPTVIPLGVVRLPVPRRLPLWWQNPLTALAH